MTRIPLSENEKGRKVVIILSVFMALDILFVAARIRARYLRKQGLAFNDWALLAALVSESCTSQWALTFIHTRYDAHIHQVSTAGMYADITALVLYGGVGLHVVDLIQNYGGMPTIFTAGKLVLAADILWYVSLCPEQRGNSRL